MEPRSCCIFAIECIEPWHPIRSFGNAFRFSIDDLEPVIVLYFGAVSHSTRRVCLTEMAYFPKMNDHNYNRAFFAQVCWMFMPIVIVHGSVENLAV